MNPTTISIVKDFAKQQVSTLNILIEALDTLEDVREANEIQSRSLNEAYKELSLSNDRIQEDQATITIKDEQLKRAEDTIAKMQESTDLPLPQAGVAPPGSDVFDETNR